MGKLAKRLDSCNKTAFTEDDKLREWFKMWVALVFIPRSFVQDIFAEKILEEAPFEKYPTLVTFTKYLEIIYFLK